MFMRDVDLEYYAKQKGIQIGKAKSIIAIIDSVQNKNDWTLEETLKLLGVSKEEYKKSLSILESSNQL